jgi:hypothetical protein
VTKKMQPRPIEPVRRFGLTREEAAASIGVSVSHFERYVQAELKVVPSGQLILIPPSEMELYMRRHARYLVDAPVRSLRQESETG